MNILMTTLITVHVLVSIALILIVLFQADKGEGLAGAFGGGASYAVFGDQGPTTFLGKLTIVAAVVFMITSLSLAYLTAKQTKTVIPSMKNVPTQSVPVQNK